MRQGLAESGSQSTALPIEIGFLARHGYAPEMLRQAAIFAHHAGVSADEFLLKQRIVGEAEFYRALAAELGVPFASAPHLSRAARYPDSILAGFAPLAGKTGGFVVAPRGAALSQILKAPFRVGRVVVTTPTGLREAVFQAQAQQIAHRAASDLPERMPDLSTDVSYGQIALMALLIALVTFSAPLFPGPTLAALALAMGPLFLGMIVLRVATTMLRNPVDPAPDPFRAEDASLPVYTIIVALYREKRIAARLLQALLRLDYPAAKLDIKLVLETGDAETLEALRVLDLPGNVEILIAPRGEPRTKPRALNVALPLARGLYTAIYDAEDVPDPNQLRLAAKRFTEAPRNVACLQARLSIDNTDDSWLTRLFRWEYATRCE